MSATEIRYSVVIPVYGNAESLPQVIERLEWLQGRLDSPLEAVFVVDGSPDDSLAVLRGLLPQSTLRSQLISHSRNFGSFAAIRTGFLRARGEYIAAMAADLQEPAELVETFFDKLATGEWDIAVGTRLRRGDPWGARTASRVYWGLYRRLVQRDMPSGGVDIYACTRAVAQKFADLDESNSSLIGLLFWLGYRRVEVPYSRREREHGTSGWSTRKKVRYLLDSVFSFTSLPITIILVVGVLGTVASFVAALVVFCAWLFGSIEVPGYTAEMLVLLLAAGSILSALGIVGTYVWRTFENTKGRPISVVMAQEEFGG
jgi:polyisoprenyl-phosphate glycosyltransferase